ncbi:MAG: phosphocholine cytidylyltransferase family protein [Eubacterium sp.]|nr:phosphocholine cytidylyltransferase family protein [Eubacterium sp.]
MKAVLLAAGRGTRIARNVEMVPKSTLPVNGVPLIRNSVGLLQAEGLECVVCTGYCENKIKEALGGIEHITYCYNPFYDITNSIASLWFARNELNDDLLVLNADVFFSREILELVIHDSRSPVMAIDQSRTKEGDYFFYTALDGRIEKYGKGLPLEQRTCEYVGMAKIEKNFLPHFISRMDEMIQSQKHDAWWENILYSYTDNREKDVYTVDVDGRFWAEIDYFDDYERIIDYVSKSGESVTAL